MFSKNKEGVCWHKKINNTTVLANLFGQFLIKINKFMEKGGGGGGR